jgi:polyphosphate kinase
MRMPKPNKEKTSHTHTGTTPTSVALIDRDLSLLAFNHRVLEWARRPDVPLLERLRYLCIVSSNLDELFEVRAELHLQAWRAGDSKGIYTVASFEAVHRGVHELVREQYELFNGPIANAFAAQRISILAHNDRNAAQRHWVKQYFQEEVQPLLVPVLLDPAHPFPQVASKSLNFIVELGGTDAFTRSNNVAIVKVPRVLPRVIALPPKLCGSGKHFVSLSSVIRAHLDLLFPGRQVGQFSQFRVTRHSDLAIDEEEVKNLRAALRQGLQHRSFGQAMRVEVSSSCSDSLAQLLLKQFELPEPALYRVSGPVNLVRFGQLADLVDSPKMRFASFSPGYPQSLKGMVKGFSMFERLKQGDVLIHQPYESFEAVIDFLREAVYDPKVLAIKQTIYRTGSDSVMMELLLEAVRRGKEVLAVVELKARFDEEANINWAERLEAVGAQVVYGVVGLKTHAKMLLVTRREGRQLKRYGHLSTGNYNPKTAKLYTDLSYLSADTRLTSDMDKMFLHLANQNDIPKLKKLIPAPFALQRELTIRIKELALKSAQGKSCQVMAKMNSLTDETLILALVAAAQAGVQIDLIVRGACTLQAGQPGLTDNIRVRSVIGRFLEHSRIFYFRCDQEQTLLLASADWMNRNMLRRIELAWPVEDAALRARVRHECLDLYLQDRVDAWQMEAGGRYEPVRPASEPVSNKSVVVRGRKMAPRTSARTRATQLVEPPPLSAQATLMATYGTIQ